MLEMGKHKITEYYEEDKLKIASYNIWEKLTVRKLELSRKTVQKAYKEMKRFNFKGDIIDFICFDSLLEFVVNVTLGYEILKSMKKTFEYLEAYLDIHKHITVPICRLLLKDESYLEEAFSYKQVTPDDKIFIESKKVLVKRINLLLKYKPQQPNKSANLNRD